MEIEQKWLETLLKRAENVEKTLAGEEINKIAFASQLNQLLGYISSANFIIKNKKHE